MENLLIIIPAYNEAGSIESVIKRLSVSDPDAKLLVVDDGSKDETYKLCRALQRDMARNDIRSLSIARHRCNIGLAGAIRTGMKYALRKGYSYALQFDGDGQHDENAIRDMLEMAINEKCDIVIGSRFIGNDYRASGLKRIGKNLISACIRLTTGVRITDPTSGMRLYNRKIMGSFAKSTHYSPEPDMLARVIRGGAKVSEVPVKMHDRISGQSYLDKTESAKYVIRMCASILIVQRFLKD